MALIDTIKIDKNAPTTSPKAGDLMDFKNAVVRVLMLGPPLLNTMNHSFNDSDPQAIVWTELEALFGIPEGKGQTVFDMCNGVMGAVNGTMQNSQASQLTARIV